MTMALAHLLRQLLWREEVERLQRELAEQEATEHEAREVPLDAITPDPDGGVIP